MRIFSKALTATPSLVCKSRRNSVQLPGKPNLLLFIQTCWIFSSAYRQNILFQPTETGKPAPWWRGLDKWLCQHHDQALVRLIVASADAGEIIQTTRKFGN
jgi:hypothetical protein